MLPKIKASIHRAYVTILSKKYINLGFFVVSLLVWYFFGEEAAFFFYLLGVSIINHFSTKVLVVGALVCLISIPLLLIFEESLIAEQMAVYVYYLLVSTVIVEIITYIRTRKSGLSEDTIQPAEQVIPQLTTLEKTIPALTYKPKTVSMEFIRPTSLTSTLPSQPTSVEPIIEESTRENTTDSFDFKETIEQFSLKQSTTKKVPKFTYAFLLKYWNVYIVVLSAFLPLLIFQFTGLPSFRDLTTVPYFFNLQSSTFDLSTIEKIIFNQFTQILSPEIIASIFFQFFFFLGAVASYFYLLRIQYKFSSNTTYLHSYANRSLIFIISLLYVYNPFTFERFLMGHHFVLRGHLLFIPVLFYLLSFLEVFTRAKQPQFKLLNEHNIQRFTAFGWAITLMALLSTHHAVFIIYVAIVGAIFLIISHFSVITSYLKKTEITQSLNQMVKVATILLLIILPTIIIFINRYANTPQQATYNQQKTQQPEMESRIISAFSLKVLDDQNLVEKALIGAASWNTPSFIEVPGVANSLGNIRKISVYFSPKLNILLIIFMVALIGYCAFLADRYFKPLIFPLLLLLPVILILNFGYSLNFESINSLFFKLPFSYTFREPGKFYSLFLALLAVVLVTSSEYFHKLIHKSVIAVFSIVLLGNLVIFLPLSQNIVYADYSQIYKEVSDTCKRSDKTKILFLPFNTYIYPSYSSVFTANFSKSLLNCEVINPDFATLENRDSNQKVTDTVEITNSKISTSINGIINTFTRSTPAENPYENLRKELKTFGINTLIIDETNYADTAANDLGVFNKKLQQYLPPEKVDKDDTKSIYVYILK